MAPDSMEKFMEWSFDADFEKSGNKDFKVQLIENLVCNISIKKIDEERSGLTLTALNGNSSNTYLMDGEISVLSLTRREIAKSQFKKYVINSNNSNYEILNFEAQLCEFRYVTFRISARCTEGERKKARKS